MVLKVLTMVLYRDILIVSKQMNVRIKIKGAMKMIYGYARISTRQQSIERQIRNIKAEYSDAVIVKEEYTGTTTDRPEWNKLYRQLKEGDTVIFDSVSRMSRDAEEGTKLYFELYDKGVNLIFLKESYINTAVYRESIEQTIGETGNEIADMYIETTNKVIRLLAKKQIAKAFEQAEKEVKDLHQRTKEGIKTARINGKQIGQRKGAMLNVKKKEPAKKQIRKLSRDFEGSNTDAEVMKIVGLSRNTYYRYKKQVREEQA